MAVSCLMKASLRPAVRLIWIYVQLSRGSHYSVFLASGQYLRQSYLIGSYCGNIKLWLDPCWLWLSFMHSRGGVRKKHGSGGADGASISLRLISAHVRPETIFSWPKLEVHKANLTMLSLHFLLGLNSHFLCLPLQLLIMMSILSYLLGSAWLLISGRHSSATLLVPAPPTAQQTISVFSSFLLFLFFLDIDLLPLCLLFGFLLLTPDKQNLTSVSEIVSTIHSRATANLAQAWQSAPLFNQKKKLFYMLISFKIRCATEWRSFPLKFFFFFSWLLQYQRYRSILPNHLIISVSYLSLICIASSKEAPTGWLGSVITFVIILIPTAS